MDKRFVKNRKCYQRKGRKKRKVIKGLLRFREFPQNNS